jgi:hypothetical protein
MEETDQELQYLLHYLNLPGTVRAAAGPCLSLAGQHPGFAERPRSSQDPKGAGCVEHG